MDRRPSRSAQAADRSVRNNRRAEVVLERGEDPLGPGTYRLALPEKIDRYREPSPSSMYDQGARRWEQLGRWHLDNPLLPYQAAALLSDETKPSGIVVASGAVAHDRVQLIAEHPMSQGGEVDSVLTSVLFLETLEVVSGELAFARVSAANGLVGDVLRCLEEAQRWLSVWAISQPGVVDEAVRALLVKQRPGGGPPPSWCRS